MTARTTNSSATIKSTVVTATAATVDGNPIQNTESAELTSKPNSDIYVVEQYQDPDPLVQSILQEHVDEYERLSNGKIRCKMTGMELVCRPEILESYYKGRAFRRGKARAVSPPPDLEKYAPYIVAHKFYDAKAYCRLTKITLNRKSSEIEKHITGRRYQTKYAKILARRKRLQEIEEKRKKAQDSNDINDVFGRIPGELFDTHELGDDSGDLELSEDDDDEVNEEAEEEAENETSETEDLAKMEQEEQEEEIDENVDNTSQLSALTNLKASPNGHMSGIKSSKRKKMIPSSTPSKTANSDQAPNKCYRKR